MKKKKENVITFKRTWREREYIRRKRRHVESRCKKSRSWGFQFWSVFLDSVFILSLAPVKEFLILFALNLLYIESSFLEWRIREDKGWRRFRFGLKDTSNGRCLSSIEARRDFVTFSSQVLSFPFSRKKLFMNPVFMVGSIIIPGMWEMLYYLYSKWARIRKYYVNNIKFSLPFFDGANHNLKYTDRLPL